MRTSFSRKPPPRPHHEHSETPTERAWPIVLSARSEDALRGSALHLAHGSRSARTPTATRPLLPDLVYSLGARRNHHPHRLTLVAQFDDRAGPGTRRLRRRSRRARRSAPPSLRAAKHAPRIAFVMSGQGPQWWGMGRELMQPRAGLPRDHRTLRRRDETVGALFAARGTRPHRGDLADAPHGDRAAGDLRDAGRAGGAVEVVGRRSPRRSSATASARSPRLASPACSAWKKARGSSCCARASWTTARAAKARCSPWVSAKRKRVR